ncbi:MAG: hypothetical protein NDI69_01850 [Bacteriovoracaceae bacterium]|nr:hypothetical protein [Bacteriovoracaceae bacterium]
MKYFLIALLLGSSIAHAQHSHGHDHKMSVARKALSSQDKTWVQSVLNKNDELFNAFLKKDNALIEKKAKELSSVVSKSSSFKEIGAQAQKLNLIKASSSRESNMAAYESFLNPLIKLVQTYDVGSKFNIFSCPMVNKSWIQNTDVNKDVRNVYAMEMLECGTQDTKF